jgi:hypothetical protein
MTVLAEKLNATRRSGLTSERASFAGSFSGKFRKVPEKGGKPLNERDLRRFRKMPKKFCLRHPDSAHSHAP